MNRPRFRSFVAAAVLAAAPLLVLAGNYGDANGQDDADYYGTAAAASRYAAEGEYDTAQVLSAEPLRRQVRISVPQQECYNETHYVPVSDGRYGGAASAAGPMILGGLIGAVIGHQIGNRDSRNAGTVVGAVIGTAIGHEAAQQGRSRDAAYGRDELRAVAGEHCEVHAVDRFEERIDGYRVTYRYSGRIYTTQLPRDPGATLRVRVNIVPVG